MTTSIEGSNKGLTTESVIHSSVGHLTQNTNLTFHERACRIVVGFVFLNLFPLIFLSIYDNVWGLLLLIFPLLILLAIYSLLTGIAAWCPISIAIRNRTS